jgi:hypothetical protein
MGASAGVPVNEEHRKILEAERIGGKTAFAPSKNDLVHGHTDDSKVSDALNLYCGLILMIFRPVRC